jgi:rhodanese-related sulfurtransferase
MDIKEIILKGAIMIDVRTKEEYAQKHAKGSLNIPLDEIGEAVTWLIKDIPIVTCCETGSRSETAKDILEANGFEKVYNGGSCNNLDGIKSSAGCSVKH